MSKPVEGSYPAFFQNYIKLVPQDDLAEVFAAQQHLIDQFFADIPEEKTNYGYAPGKWSLKVLLQHIIDAERVFNYRALCIARGEQQSLPGFEEDDYAASSKATLRGWHELVEELKIVRQATVLLFKSFPPNSLDNVGLANGKTITVNALGYITAGHVYHHVNIVKERYL
jgi:hypothetical protein